MTSATERPPAPGIAVVVPCRGHAETLRACLNSLCSQRISVDYEVILVDSASDPAVAAVATEFAAVRVVRSKRPLYAGPARNLGTASTTAAYLAFLDADCVAEDDWLACAYSALHGGAEAVGGPVADADPRHPIAVADNLLQFYDLVPGRPSGPTGYLPSCNLAMRRDVLEALGGFSAVSPGQDVLLTQQIAARGPGCLLFNPTVRVRHQGRRTFSDFWRHHRAFGRARGEHQLRTGRLEARLSRYRAYVGVLIAKRIAYMTVRVARFSPTRLPRFLLLSPLLLLGVTSWAIGVVEGSRRRAARQRTDSPEERSTPGKFPVESNQ